jgi:hypothetical protein
MISTPTGFPAGLPALLNFPRCTAHPVSPSAYPAASSAWDFERGGHA